MLMVTDYLPDQLDMGIHLSVLGVDLARNGVTLGARQLVLGIMQTQQAMRRAGENLANQEENWKRALLSYDRGMITESDKLAARADYEEAKLTLDRFVMDNKDYVRRLNQLMGKPVESAFVFLREQPLALPLEREEAYIGSALENRFEILQIEESIDLKDKEIALYEIYGLKDDQGLKSTYSRLLVERDQLDLQLDDAKADIVVEVKTAYRQAVTANQQRIALTASRDAKRTLLSNLKVQKEMGFVSDAVFDGTENALKELEEGVDLLVLQYNTSRMALDFASQVGPGLTSGVTP
jgi:outer membrane protein TolC